MKLRIRYKVKTSLIEVDNSATFGYLHSLAQSTFQLGTNIMLSLNNKTPIDGCTEQSLSDVGLVSGDLIYVVANNNSSTVSSSPNVVSSSSSTTAAAAAADGDAVMSQSSTCSSPNVDTTLSGGTNPEPTNSASLTDNMPSSACNRIGICDSSTLRPDSASVVEVAAENNMKATSSASSMDCIPSQTQTGMNVDENPDDLHVVDPVQVNRYLNEPMSVREATATQLPQSLVSLFAHVQPQSRDAALLVTLDVLMSELGYQLTGSHSSIDWHMKAGTVRLSYTYPQLAGVEFQLQCVPMLRTLVVHGFVRLCDSSVERMRLPISVPLYVNNDIASDPVAVYRGASLAQLSRLFKDSIAYPLLQTAFRATDEAVLPALDTVFYELKLNIMKYLDSVSLVRLSAVNSQLCDVARQPVLWRRLYVADFGSLSDMSLAQDWINKYREKFVERKKRREQFRDAMRFIVPPPFITPPIPTPPFPFPFHPPGNFIIGGDYDLRPNLSPDPVYLPNPLNYAGRLGPDAMFEGPTLSQQLPSVHPSTVSFTPPSLARNTHNTSRPFNMRFL